MAEVSKRFLNNKLQPFLGHPGTGARVELVNQSSKWILRETLASQLLLILPMVLIGFYPLWLLANRTEQIRGGVVSYFILGLASFVGIAAWVKYTARLLGKRRIEIDLATQAVRLVARAQKSEHTVPFAQVRSLRCDVSDYSHGRGSTKNFSLILSLDGDAELNLATSDKEINIRPIAEKLAQLLPVKNG